MEDGFTSGAIGGKLQNLNNIKKKKIMKNIFVQIKCELGEVYGVAEGLVDSLEEMEEIYSISGAFDLMIKIHLDDSEDIGRYVNERVQTVKGIRDTFTIMAFKAFK